MVDEWIPLSTAVVLLGKAGLAEDQLFHSLELGDIRSRGFDASSGLGAFRVRSNVSPNDPIEPAPIDKTKWAPSTGWVWIAERGWLVRKEDALRRICAGYSDIHVSRADVEAGIKQAASTKQGAPSPLGKTTARQTDQAHTIEAAMKALWPNGVPDQSTVQNATFARDIEGWIGAHHGPSRVPSRKTILRRAGRMKAPQPNKVQ